MYSDDNGTFFGDHLGVLSMPSPLNLQVREEFSYTQYSCTDGVCDPNEITDVQVSIEVPSREIISTALGDIETYRVDYQIVEVPRADDALWLRLEAVVSQWIHPGIGPVETRVEVVLISEEAESGDADRLTSISQLTNTNIPLPDFITP